jgi:hypothetical protein
MHEQSKVNEAGYFYSGMLSEIGNRENFLYELSAFLSSARSVLQYALKEAETKSRGKTWYDAEMSGSAVLSFFKDKRDINVHTKPLAVNQRSSAQITGVARISGTLHVKAFDQNGQVIAERSSEPPQETSSPGPSPVVTHKFVFPDWTGSEDLLQLCQIYLNELQRVVTEGQHRGFLTM